MNTERKKCKEQKLAHGGDKYGMRYHEIILEYRMKELAMLLQDLHAAETATAISSPDYRFVILEFGPPDHRQRVVIKPKGDDEMALHAFRQRLYAAAVAANRGIRPRSMNDAVKVLAGTVGPRVLRILTNTEAVVITKGRSNTLGEAADRPHRAGPYELRFAKTETGGEIAVYLDGTHAGSAKVDPSRDGQGWSVMNIHLNAEHRRKGLATAIYDLFYRKGFRPLVPDSKQSPDGQAFWHAHQRKKMRMGKPLPPMEWKPQRGGRDATE